MKGASNSFFTRKKPPKVRLAMLEDSIGDILEKARKGQALDAARLCAEAGISESAYQRLLRGGPPSDGALQHLARLLHLNAEGLGRIARGSYRPEPALLPAALERVETRGGSYAVYAYLWKLPHARACLLFDAGFEAGPILEAIERTKCSLKGVFITHPHHDHIGGLSALKKRFPQARVFIPQGVEPPSHDAETLRGGEHILFEKIPLRALSTPGHTPAALSYFLENPDWPVAFTGDALFAGSMGGAPDAYATALSSARAITSLPPATLLCPGHGPYTTVGYEQKHNPFLPIP